MKELINAAIRWMAQKYIIEAVNMAMDETEHMTGRVESAKRISAPEMPRIEYHRSRQ